MSQIKLVAVSSCYNESRLPAGTRNLISHVEHQIAYLQEKADLLRTLEFGLQSPSDIRFDTILELKLRKSYVRSIQEADHYATKYEQYFFDVVTEKGTFLSALIFEGGNPFEEDVRYRLYMPRMGVFERSLVRNAILALTNYEEVKANRPRSMQGIVVLEA